MVMYMISDFCPIQYEGEIYGYPAYARARHGYAHLSIAKKNECPISQSEDNLIWSYGEDCDSYCLSECGGLILEWIEEFRFENGIEREEKEHVLLEAPLKRMMLVERLI